jgi:hypothetical protein
MEEAEELRLPEIAEIAKESKLKTSWTEIQQ